MRRMFAWLLALLFLIIGFIGGAFSTWELATARAGRTKAAYLQTELYRLYDAYTLVKVFDNKPQDFINIAVARAQYRTIKVANLFGRLNSDQQRDVLHIFAELSKSPSIQSDRSQIGTDAAHVRTEVLTTHRPASDSGGALTGN